MEYLFAKPEEYLDFYFQQLDSKYLYELSDNTLNLIGYLALNDSPSKTRSVWYAKNLLSQKQFELTPELSRLLMRVENPLKIAHSLGDIADQIKIFPSCKNPSVEQHMKTIKKNKPNLSEQNFPNTQ